MKNSELYRVVLLLGSNLPYGSLLPPQIIGEADKEIVDALLPDYLEVESLEEAVSATEIIETEPCGKFEEETGEDGTVKETPVFYNQVFCCITEKTPEEVLLQAQRIEKIFGRTRTYKQKGIAYQSRTLDIDILQIFKRNGADNIADAGADKMALWSEIKIDTPRLTLPHPQIEERPFVKPLIKNLARPKVSNKR